MRCGEEIPLVKGAERAFADKEIGIIWIGFQDKEERIREFAAKNGISKDLGYDKGDVVSKKYGMNYGAGVVVIDQKGIVKVRLPKGFSGKKLHEAIARALRV